MITFFYGILKVQDIHELADKVFDNVSRELKELKAFYKKMQRKIAQAASTAVSDAIVQPTEGLLRQFYDTTMSNTACFVTEIKCGLIPGASCGTAPLIEKLKQSEVLGAKCVGKQEHTVFRDNLETARRIVEAVEKYAPEAAAEVGVEPKFSHMCQGFLKEYSVLSQRVNEVANGAPSVADSVPANLDCHLTPHRRATDLDSFEFTPSSTDPMNYETRLKEQLEELERLKAEIAETPQADLIRAELQTEKEEKCVLIRENLQLQRKIRSLEARRRPSFRSWLRCCFRPQQVEAEAEVFEVPPSVPAARQPEW